MGQVEIDLEDTLKEIKRVINRGGAIKSRDNINKTRGAVVVNENTTLDRSHKIIDITPLFYGIDVNEKYCFVKTPKIEPLSKSVYNQGNIITGLKKENRHLQETLGQSILDDMNCQMERDLHDALKDIERLNSELDALKDQLAMANKNKCNMVMKVTLDTSDCFKEIEKLKMDLIAKRLKYLSAELHG